MDLIWFCSFVWFYLEMRSLRNSYIQKSYTREEALVRACVRIKLVSETKEAKEAEAKEAKEAKEAEAKEAKEAKEALIEIHEGK